MRNILLIILLSLNLYSNDIAIRYLKLGNTYREALEFDKAEEYISKGKKLLNSKNKSDKYWLAVSEEYYGFLFNDLSRKFKENQFEFYKNKSKVAFENAIKIYKEILSFKDASFYPLEEIKENINLIKSKYLDKSNNDLIVNLDNNKLKKIPADLNKSLKNLSLTENKINEISSSISNYKNLEQLNLSKNKIKKIENLKENKKLNWLDLSNNKIKTLDESICNLTEIKYLNLYNNKISKLPNCICELKNLKVLNLKQNKISFNEISNLIRCLPNTNIIFDEFKLEKK